MYYYTWLCLFLNMVVAEEGWECCSMAEHFYSAWTRVWVWSPALKNERRSPSSLMTHFEPWLEKWLKSNSFWGRQDGSEGKGTWWKARQHVFNPLTHMKERENHLYTWALKFTTAVSPPPTKLKNVKINKHCSIILSPIPMLLNIHESWMFEILRGEPETWVSGTSKGDNHLIKKVSE